MKATIETTGKPKNVRDSAITILLVDDDVDCRMLIRDAICQSKVSNRVFEVSSGEEAMDFLHRRGQWSRAPRPGLIYLDIEMPGMDGQSVLKAIKADPDLRDIPVVMMTGVSDEQSDADGGQGRGKQLYDKAGQGGSVSEDGGHEHELLADDPSISGPPHSTGRLPETVTA